MERDEEIRLIAYRIWEEEGREHGNSFDQWLKAEAIWEEQQKAKPAPETPTQLSSAVEASPPVGMASSIPSLSATPANLPPPEPSPRPKPRTTTRRPARRTIKKPPETGENPSAP